MDSVQVANVLVNHLIYLSQTTPNDKELGEKTREFMSGLVKMQKEHDAHDAEVKKLIDEN